jgi:hypothetical protein
MSTQLGLPYNCLRPQQWRSSSKPLCSTLKSNDVQTSIRLITTFALLSIQYRDGITSVSASYLRARDAAHRDVVGAQIHDLRHDPNPRRPVTYKERHSMSHVHSRFTHQSIAASCASSSCVALLRANAVKITAPYMSSKHENELKELDQKCAGRVGALSQR